MFPKFGGKQLVLGRRTLGGQMPKHGFGTSPSTNLSFGKVNVDPALDTLS